MEGVQHKSLAKRKTPTRLTSKERGDRIFAYLLNVPSIALILALIAYPVGVSLWTSLRRYNLRRPGQFDFIGLSNYIDILSSYDFWHSLRVTLYFSGMGVTLVIIVAIGIALLFNERFVGRGVVRSLLLIPWAVPGLVNGLMWAGLFGEHGAFNKIVGDWVNLFNTLTGLEIDYLGMASPVCGRTQCRYCRPRLAGCAVCVHYLFSCAPGNSCRAISCSACGRR